MDHLVNQEWSPVIGRFTVGNLGFLNKKINKIKKKINKSSIQKVQ